MCKMAESSWAEFQHGRVFKMTTIIKLESEWINEVFFLIQLWLNPRWQQFKSVWHQSSLSQKMTWVTVSKMFKMAESKMAEFKIVWHHQVESEWISLRQFSFVQNCWIQDGSIQDDCHHKVGSEWMSLNQIELVWIRVLFKMAESKMADFKMADIIMLGKNEWVWVRLNWFESGRSESVFEWIWKKITRCLNSRWQCLNPTMAEFKMAAIIKLSQNVWVKCFMCKWWKPILASVSEFERKY